MSSSFTPVQFVKLVPGGNPTILVHGILPGAAAWPRLAARLVHPMHVQAEQAGAVQLPCGEQLAHLHMMGGEFCVNATRAAAFWLARQGVFAPCGAGAVLGSMTVSGAVAPVTVLVARTAAELCTLMQRFEAGELPGQPCHFCQPGQQAAVGAVTAGEARETGEEERNAAGLSPFGVQGAAAARLTLDAADWRMQQLGEGAIVVHLPGISHVLLDAAVHAVPQMPAQYTAAWRSRAGLENCEASGVIWYMPCANGFAIVPVVYVRDTNTEHAETACGSGSLALGLVLQHKGLVPQGAAISIIQPSGEALLVQFFDAAQETAGNATGAGGACCHAYVAGAVQLVAEGTAYCE